MLQEQGAEKTYIDKQSGKSADRPQLQEMLSFARQGDIIIVESISRLARNTRDLLNIVEQIREKGAQFISLKENIDTESVSGKFMLTVFAAMAELERGYILERQREGIDLAKAQGKYAGRKPIDIDEGEFKRVCGKWRAGEITATAAMPAMIFGTVMAAVIPATAVPAVAALPIITGGNALLLPTAAPRSSQISSGMGAAP